MSERISGMTSTSKKLFGRVDLYTQAREQEAPCILFKCRLFLRDEPGSLAEFSSLVAQNRGNISFFHYDRSKDCNRVVIEVWFSGRDELDSLLRALERQGHCTRRSDDDQDEVRITTLENVLEIQVRLAHKPGSLAAFARLLREHHANVIYMLYDECMDPESADIAVATENTEEIDGLLAAINQKDYHYKVVYRGSDQEGADHVIGLNLVEKFFLSLRKLLSDKDIQELRTVVRSSKELYADLVDFYSEVGNNLDMGDVFGNVLALASMSVSKTGSNFHARELPLVEIEAGIRIFAFRLPSGGNIFVFQHGDELTMIDAGYGLYYEDIKALLRERSLDPALLRRIFVSHPDADHIGASGYFAEEFGTQVLLHPASRGVMENENRAYGVNGRLSELNKCFTRLVNEFTKCKYPQKVSFFSTSRAETVGDFYIIDAFSVGGFRFQVLESHGGHIPGQVFFLQSENGLLFTSDYLINIGSLSTEDRDNLSVPRYLMTSTNTNSQVFREESEALENLARSLDADMKRLGKFARIFPGHGDYYRVDGR